MRHPRDMGAPEVEAFLTHLATARQVSASSLQWPVKLRLSMPTGDKGVAQRCHAECDVRRQRHAERARSRTCTWAGPADRENVPSAVAVGQTTVSNCAASDSGMKRVREA